MLPRMDPPLHWCHLRMDSLMNPCFAQEQIQSASSKSQNLQLQTSVQSKVAFGRQHHIVSKLLACKPFLLSRWQGIGLPEKTTAANSSPSRNFVPSPSCRKARVWRLKWGSNCTRTVDSHNPSLPRESDRGHSHLGAFVALNSTAFGRAPCRTKRFSPPRHNPRQCESQLSP